MTGLGSFFVNLDNFMHGENCYFDTQCFLNMNKPSFYYSYSYSCALTWAPLGSEDTTNFSAPVRDSLRS